MPLISVIVPIYNGEEYLSRCIDSILAQRFDDFELLLINDGSKDNSLEICKRYAQEDKRIRVYDIPNGGVSAARNFGINKSSGEWIMFVDSDDWVENTLLDTGVPYFNDYDLINIATYIDETINGVEYKQFALSKNADQFIKHILRRKARQSIWGVFIRRSILIDNNILFDTTYNYAEDWHMIFRIAINSSRVKIINDIYPYHYNMLNVSSCSNTISIQKLSNTIRFISYARNVLKGKFNREIDFTKMTIYLSFIRRFDKDELCDYLLSITEQIEFYTLWDIIKADFGIKSKISLYKFLCYANSRGLIAVHCGKSQ